MSQKPYVIDNMISAKSIAARIEQLAAEIEQEFADTDKLVVVGLLRGSFVFIADLVREINLPIGSERARFQTMLAYTFRRPSGGIEIHVKSNACKRTVGSSLRTL